MGVREDPLAEPPWRPPASTFVIRFWREWSGIAGRWCGRIEHVQSGQCADLAELEGILKFVQGFGIVVEDRSTPLRTDEKPRRSLSSP